MLGQVGTSYGMTSASTSSRKPDDSTKAFLYVYLVFGAGVVLTCQTYKNLGMSTLITFNVALQLLAYSFLLMKVIQQKSVSGVSAKALQCNVVTYIARLCSTTWLKGYIPMDPTANGLYQGTDVMCLVTVLFLLYLTFWRYRSTYQEDLDSFDISYLLGGCFVLSVLLHPSLNNRPLFDTLWTLALYVDVFAMLPQLWMVGKIQVGGELEALNAHYIGAIAASRLVSLYFWWYGYREFAPKNGGFNLNGYAILGAHIIQVLLLLDFVYFYVKSCIKGCVRAVQTGDYSMTGLKMSESFQL